MTGSQHYTGSGETDRREGDTPRISESTAVPELDRVQMLVNTLKDCLAEIDRLDVPLAGAHVDSALQALHRRYGAASEVSDLE